MDLAAFAQGIVLLQATFESQHSIEHLTQHSTHEQRQRCCSAGVQSAGLQVESQGAGFQVQSQGAGCCGGGGESARCCAGECKCAVSSEGCQCIVPPQHKYPVAIPAHTSAFELGRKIDNNDGNSSSISAFHALLECATAEFQHDLTPSMQSSNQKTELSGMSREEERAESMQVVATRLRGRIASKRRKRTHE